MSASIPNLKSFVEARMHHEDDNISRGSDTNYQRVSFQKQGAKVLKKDQNYKKNLFSAMTTRVIK